MADSKSLWTVWQSLLSAFRPVFTRPGWMRFVQWATGWVVCAEDHLLTRTLLALGLESHWRAMERFVEYGAWRRSAVEQVTVSLIERECPVCWNSYRPVALDDTKSHRTSQKVWGVGTFHEYTARSPNRATTVRAHNGVVVGDLIPREPWWYLPHSGRVYFRKSQLPQGEVFRTKHALAVEMLRQADMVSKTPLLATFDGAYAQKSMISACLQPQEGQRRIEILTRLRRDARLYAPLEPSDGKKRGRPRQWGPRLPAPKEYPQWDVQSEEGEAFVYGQMRRFRAKRLECRWAISGANQPVLAIALEVEGYADPWFLITSATTLTTAAVGEAYAARYRQEDAFRDHKQLLGMEECRAWTKEPILRSFQIQMVVMTLLRLIQLGMEGDQPWWQRTPWYPQKRYASLLDLRRLFWQRREEFSQFVRQLGEMQKSDRNHEITHSQATRAA